MSTDTSTYCGSQSCGRPTVAGVLCPECDIELTNYIDSLPWDLEQLQYAATNQARLSVGGGAKSTETPLMFNPFASSALTSLRATTHLWQGRLADHTGTPVRFTNPIKAARWIAEHLDSTTTFINAGQMLRDLKYAHEHTENTINRPPPNEYLGDCATTDERGHTCPGAMYAGRDEPEAKCDTCGKTINAEERRNELLCELDDRKLSAAEIARISTYMKLSINREQVRKLVNSWSSRARIVPADSVAGESRFQFREVRLLLEQHEERAKKIA